MVCPAEITVIGKSYLLKNGSQHQLNAEWFFRIPLVESKTYM